MTATPDNLPPLEEALSRAYYYNENGEWRGSSEACPEFDRWHAVAKVAMATIAAQIRQPDEMQIDLEPCDD